LSLNARGGECLWKAAGCTTELDYTEQTSWLLFLKYLDGLEQDKADEVALEGRSTSSSSTSSTILSDCWAWCRRTGVDPTNCPRRSFAHWTFWPVGGLRRDAGAAGRSK
jgi:hypothetical protein